MYQARNIEGVVWGSEKGGSGILTPAMQLLVDKGVKLETHGIFLNRATTMPSKVIELGRKLGINSNDMDKKSGFSLNELAGQLSFLDTPLSNIERLKSDDYSFGNLMGDTARGTYNALGDANSVLGAAALMGMGGALVSAPAIATGGGILALTGLVIKGLKKTAPNLMNKKIL